MTCPLKVNIKSEIWVIYGTVLHRQRQPDRRAHAPGTSKSEWASGRAPPSSSHRDPRSVSTGAKFWGRRCTAFKRSHFPGKSFLKTLLVGNAPVCTRCVCSCAPSRLWALIPRPSVGTVSEPTRPNQMKPVELGEGEGGQAFGFELGSQVLEHSVK